ncbi:MAG TPA: glucans biosynthesis glucosyltransferase MdoH, partial [Verrucomicrobiae bacterium]|nr:glucans biosynthesis glucosyltransferase MdoH [Verrucomicrobiae bacterium]
DRRWCQGNLQHILVLFAPGLRGISRMHLLFGIFAYLGGPLWLLFLLAFNAKLIAHKETGLSDITVRPWTPFLHLSATQHAILIFGLSMFVLLLPKILALAELAFQPERRRAFGGLGRACLSSFLELVFSTLQAPLLMLWHTEFVITIILGRSVSWGKQNRQADGASWGYALRQHWKHTLAGILWGVAAWQMDHALFWWFMPVLAGMLFAIPFTVFSSRCQPGESSRKAGLFLTPEEVEPPKEIVQLRAALANLAKTAPTKPAEEKVFAETVLSPWRNALHLSLLQVQKNHPTFVEGVKKLGEGQPSLKNLRQKTMTEGWSSLNAKQKLLLLADGESLSWLHRELWRTPLNLLPKPWRQEFN